MFKKIKVNRLVYTTTFLAVEWGSYLASQWLLLTRSRSTVDFPLSPNKKFHEWTNREYWLTYLLFYLLGSGKCEICLWKCQKLSFYSLNWMIHRGIFYPLNFQCIFFKCLTKRSPWQQHVYTLIIWHMHSKMFWNF